MTSYIDDLLNILRGHSAVRGIRVIYYHETPAGNVEIKIRCRFAKNFQLQIRLHETPRFRSYAYQLFTNHPILRWDNAPHYPHIATAPHHFHDDAGKVWESPLTGEPVKDLALVLSEIEKWQARSQ
jgi:hypothetical protein